VRNPDGSFHHQSTLRNRVGSNPSQRGRGIGGNGGNGGSGGVGGGGGNDADCVRPVAHVGSLGSFNAPLLNSSKEQHKPSASKLAVNLPVIEEGVSPRDNNDPNDANDPSPRERGVGRMQSPLFLPGSTAAPPAAAAAAATATATVTATDRSASAGVGGSGAVEAGAAMVPRRSPRNGQSRAPPLAAVYRVLLVDDSALNRKVSSAYIVPI